MRFTKYFNFKKPEPFDTVNINDLNDSFDLIDNKLKETVDENKNLLTMFKNLIINAGNSNAEVAASRGKFDLLPYRLNNTDLQIEELKQIKANQKEVTELSNVFNDAVANVTNGNESATNTEVVSARNGMTSLKLRVDNIESAALRDVIDLVPLCTKIGYLHMTTGDSVGEGSDSNWKMSDYIEINSMQSVYYDAGASYNMASIAVYDENKKILKTYITPQQTGGLFNFIKVVDLIDHPAAKYIRVCFSATMKHKNIIFLFTNLKETKRNIDNLNNFVDQVNDNIDAVPYMTYIGYINPNGTLTTGDKNWLYSDFIPVDFKYINLDVMSSSDMCTVAFYDKDETFLGRITSPSKQSTVLKGKYDRKDFPERTAYVRFCIATNVFLPYPYTTFTLEYPIKERAQKLDEDIKEISNEIFSSVDVMKECKNLGYLNRSGIPVSLSDVNWKHSDFILLDKTGYFSLKLAGHKLVSNLALYDSNKTFISSYGINPNADINVSLLYEVKITAEELPQNAVYYRLCHGTMKIAGTDIYYAEYNKNRITECESQIDYILDNVETPGAKLDLNYLIPPTVYTVCNDNVAGLRGHNRNYKASIYLDHMICEDFKQEKDIRFKNKSDKIDLYSPIKVIDASEAYPGVTYNEGVKILKKEIPIIIEGKDVLSKEYKTQLISTLNSATKDVTPRILCLGDSITYGELATIEDDGYAQNWAYHLMCKELFMKDKIDNGNTGHDIKFLGHFKRTRTMRYKNSDYPITTFHEGIRGISLSQYLNGQVEAFKSTTTNKFSVKSWIDRYRTLDDSGNRLTVGSGTGTLINSGNINDIDVCTPTHILIMLSSNGGFTIEQYRELINIIKSEYPNMIIGLAVPDVASTHFPSLHPKCGENTYMWNSGHAAGHSYSYHKQQYNCMKMLIEEYSNRESENIHIVPFFFVNPGAESCAMRTMYGADSDFRIMEDNLTIEQYGWVPNVHINAVGHYNWAYQLYSWLKYTVAK